MASVYYQYQNMYIYKTVTGCAPFPYLKALRRLNLLARVQRRFGPPYYLYE